MSSDDRRTAPPHELVGPLGQVIDVGGGIVPALTPTPAPGALATASPGVTTAPLAGAAAAAPSPLALLADNPNMLAAITQMANELFHLPPASAAPVPLAPASALTPANASPSATSAGQAPTHPAVRSTAAPALPGRSPSSTASAASPSAMIASPASAQHETPASSGPASLTSLLRDPAPGASVQSFALGEPWLPPHLQTSAAQAPSAQAPSVQVPAAPVPSVQVPSTQPSALPAGSGLEAPLSLDAVAAAALTMTDASTEVMRLPMLGDATADAAPSFVPAASAVGLDAPGRGVDASTYEIRSEPALVRDLGGAGFDPYAVRRDFPILEERVHGGKRLVWLDNAATTQKPRAVIDRLSYFYEHESSNIHRAAHVLAARATDAYEGGRDAARRFLNAGSDEEIIFVRGATEGINLVAQSWGRRYVEAGDEIVITHLEHHANIVPWQQLCQVTGARLRVAPVDDRGDVLLEAYERQLGPRTKLVAFPQVSNALGTVTPAREMIEMAHRHGAVVLLDGAQAVSHMRVDVQALDCDFYVLSGHKVFAPTGIGVVWGKRALLDAMPPWQGGGNMIQDVTFERTVYQAPPWRFEAGTGSIADAVGLGAALDYVMQVGIDRIERYEHDLLAYADRQLATVPGLTMIGAPREKAGVLSFVLDGHRTEDVGSALDQEGIAVRWGHHCAQPILRRFGVEASVRASLAFYNVCEDIDALVAALHRLRTRR